MDTPPKVRANRLKRRPHLKGIKYGGSLYAAAFEYAKCSFPSNPVNMNMFMHRRNVVCVRFPADKTDIQQTTYVEDVVME